MLRGAGQIGTNHFRAAEMAEASSHIAIHSGSGGRRVYVRREPDCRSITARSAVMATTRPPPTMSKRPIDENRAAGSGGST
jgi:hypothetical protein